MSNQSKINTGMSHHIATISDLPAECLLYIFHNLPLRDVFSCGRVCKSWWHLAKSKKLRRNVSMSHLNIVNWEEAERLFKEWKTTVIDFSACGEKDFNILPWKKLSAFLRELKPQLRCLRFQTLPIDVLECILLNNFKDLQGLCVKLLTSSKSYPAEYPTKDLMGFFDIGKIRKLEQLRELHINLDYDFVSHSYFSFYGGLNALENIKHLRILRLTSFASYKSYEFDFLPNLSELVEVQLGDLGALPPEAFSALAAVPNLRKLSLINGDVCGCQTTSCQCLWPDYVAKLVNLVELELDCVRIVPKLNGCLRKLTKLKELKILPVPTDFIPEWKTSFTVEEAKRSNVSDVVIGLTYLLKLTWGAWCPDWIFTKETAKELKDGKKTSKHKLYQDSVTDQTGTLIALKDMLQSHLPRTEILVIPVIDKEM